VLLAGCSAAAAPVDHSDDPAHAVPVVHDFVADPEVHTTADAFRFEGGITVEDVEIGPVPLVAGQRVTVAMKIAGVRGRVSLRVGLRPPRPGSRQVAVGGVGGPPRSVPEDPRAVTTVVPLTRDAEQIEVELSLPEPWHPEHALVGLELTSDDLGRPVRIEATQGPRTEDGVAIAGLVPVATVPTKVAAVRATAAPTIDGILDEPVWAGEGTTLVGSLHGEPWPDPSAGRPRGSAGAVHLAWDEQALYAAATFADRDVWATMTEQDDPLWKEEVFELFVFGEPRAQRYLELQVSPRGVTFDAKFETYRKGQEDWDSQWTTAVDLRGTLNNRKDRDEGWSVEVAVPWSEICEYTQAPCPPVAGATLRINAFRFERAKKREPVGLALSPTRVPDFHASANAAILELLP